MTGPTAADFAPVAALLGWSVILGWLAALAVLALVQRVRDERRTP